VDINIIISYGCRMPTLLFLRIATISFKRIDHPHHFVDVLYIVFMILRGSLPTGKSQTVAIMWGSGCGINGK